MTVKELIRELENYDPDARPMTTRRETQSELIHAHLLERGSITPIQALDLYGCFRLAARIYDLRKNGVPVADEPWETPGGVTVKKYSLPQYARADENQLELKL